MTRRFLVLAILLVIAVPRLALAQAVNADSGVALKGTDVVAYFAEGRVVEGSAQFAHRWQEAEWRFASAANRDAFAREPEKYAPQYGGFCAWGMAQGYRAPIDPAAFRVIDGKLYLNYSRSVQGTWLKDVPGNVAKADGNWAKLRGQ
jgi:hypothetical protein